MKQNAKYGHLISSQRYLDNTHIFQVKIVFAGKNFRIQNHASIFTKWLRDFEF